jgi:xyloglucan-specific exo-beta-1,4-glucanase
LQVAALNSWWPDAQVYRSNDGGISWSALWDWGVYPNLNRYYGYDDTNAPWLAPGHDFVDNVPGDFEVGWMIECEYTSFILWGYFSKFT